MLLYSFLFLIGTIVGSFLSVVSFRVYKNIQFVKGRSFCPKCRYEIRWYDNIPLLSFLLLGGKCRNCKKKISIRYPFIELATGLGFLFIGLKFIPDPISLIYNLIIFCILVLIFTVDLEHQIIPDSFVFFGIPLVILYSLIFNPSSIYSSLFAGFLASVVLLIIYFATLGRGMGLGDVKFAVFGGFIVGLKLMPVWLFASFLTGGITGIILILGRRAGLKDHIAFGPFLIVGLFLALVYGNEFIKLIWY